MQFQRLCYARLGRIEKNAGYQLAARSQAVNGDMAEYFGLKASSVESIDGSAAEGVFFSGDAAYIARFVRSRDETGRAATVSSALTLDGAAWRTLLRERPRWRLALDARAFFDRPPEDAYPGHPAEISAYDLPEETGELSGSLPFCLTNDDFGELLRAVYSCLLAATAESLFIGLPPERDSLKATRCLMTAIYTAMPASFASLLSYCCGARLSTQLVFGPSDERSRYANYVDLFPSRENANLSRVSCVQVPGTEFLDDLIAASIGENGPALLNKIDSFLDELRLFEGSATAPVGSLRGRLQYALNAAWLHASDRDALKARSPEYYCPGSDTAARTLLTLTAHLVPGRAYPRVEPVLAALLDMYTAQPLHETPSLRGVKLQKAAVERELTYARTVFPTWNGAFDLAYSRYLIGSPAEKEGKERFLENVNALLNQGSPTAYHLLAKLLDRGEYAAYLTAEEWLRLRRDFQASGHEPDAEEAAQELDEALHKAFAELRQEQREAVICGMLHSSTESDQTIYQELLLHQKEALCCLSGNAAAMELNKVFTQIGQQEEALERLFLEPDGVLAAQTDELRHDMYQKLLSSSVCTTELAKKLFQQKSLAALPADLREELFTGFFTSPAYTRDAAAEIFEQDAFRTLDDKAVSDLLCKWVKKAESWNETNSVLRQPRTGELGEDAYTSLADCILQNKRLAAVFSGGAEELLNGARIAAFSAQNRVKLLAAYLRSCPVKLGMSALKTKAAAELDTGSRQSLVEILLKRAGSEQIRELLGDKAVYSGFSEEEKTALCRVVIDCGAEKCAVLLGQPFFTNLSPAVKLELLSEYPQNRGLLQAVLIDSSVQERLLMGNQPLPPEVLERCDELYLEAAQSDAVRAFYAQYLRQQRFNPDSPQTKSELEKLAKANSEVPTRFFDELLRENSLSEKERTLADEYTEQYDLPSPYRELDAMLNDLQKLLDRCLGKSAKTYQKQIEDELLRRFDGEEQKENLLRRAEELAGGRLNLQELRNRFWETLPLDEIDFKDGAFYSQEVPSSETGQMVQKAVLQASAAYCRLGEGGEPGEEGGRELYSLAIRGKLYTSCLGSLSDTRREKLLKKLTARTKSLMKSAPEALATSPDLIVLALFGDRTKLRHRDIDKLLHWVRKADNAGVAIDKEKLGNALAIRAEKTRSYSEKKRSYYERHVDKSVDMRLVRASVAAVALTACIAGGIITIPPEIEAFSIWEKHYLGETTVFSIRAFPDYTKNTAAKLKAWLEYRQNDWKKPLSDDQLAVLEAGKDSGIYDFSNLKIDDTALNQLVSRMETATALNLSGNNITELAPLSTLPALTTLDLSGSAVSDLSPLTSLTNLTTLDLSGSAVSDLSPLTSLANLTTLDLSGSAVSDLSPLASLTNLTTLDLSGSAVSNLSPLARLINLTTLKLTGCEGVSELSPLSSLMKLEALDVSACSSLNELGGISGLSALRRLHAEGVGVSLRRLYEFAVTNDACEVSWGNGEIVKPIYNADEQLYLPGDPVLNLSGKPVTDLSFLRESGEAFSELRVLDLSCTDLDESQLSYVKELADSLRVLILYGNPRLGSDAVSELRQAMTASEGVAKTVLVLDGSEAADEEDCVYLDLSGQETVNLTEIAKEYPHLRALNLSCCGLTDLKGLSELKELEWLDISHNQLSSLQSLHDYQMDQLKWLNFSFNPAPDAIKHLRNYSSLQVLYATDLDAENMAILLTGSGSKSDLFGLTVFSVSDQVELIQVNEYLSSLAVLELRPTLQEGRFLEPIEGVSLEKLKERLPNLASGCIIYASAYEQPEENVE